MAVRRIALLLAIAATIAGCAGQGASYGLGYSVQSGAALLPPTASRGMTTMINYHEAGGAVARAILLVVTAAGLKNPNGDTSVHTDVTSDTVGDTTYVTTTTTTTFTPTSAAERAEREAAIANYTSTIAPGIIHGPLPVELDIGSASTSYGGDTSGGTFDMLFQFQPARTTGIAFGFGYQSLTFHGRTIADVVDNGTTLTSTRRMGDLEYSFVGFPVRVTQVVRNRTSVFLQWDLNLKSLTDNGPSPFTLGMLLKFPVLSLKGTLCTDRFDPRATTLGLEGILGF